MADDSKRLRQAVEVEPEITQRSQMDPGAAFGQAPGHQLVRIEKRRRPHDGGEGGFDRMRRRLGGGGQTVQPKTERSRGRGAGAR